MNVFVFEDSQVSRLYPITTARPAFSITCGCLRLVDFLASLKDVTLVAAVRPYLQPITSRDHNILTDQLNPAHTHTIVINARCVPCKETFAAIHDRLDNERESVSAFDKLGNLAIGIVETSKLLGLKNSTENISELFDDTDSSSEAAPCPSFCLPHDVIYFNQKYFNENLELLIKQRNIAQKQDGLFIADSANVDQNISVDTCEGPVVVDAGAKIKPFAYLKGPVYVGPNCSVNEHSSIKDFVCLTNTVKAGGEIEATVIEPYSNKQHHGFLGHSYLGSWINLGAGTCNSDLKNTYGKVTAVYGGEKVSTGMQFVGCFIGDYSKSAINASIYTGKSIGVCSMLYGIVPANVPSFVNYARSFDQITEVPPEVMITTQSRMFARRKVEQRDVDIQLIKDMFELTVAKRQAAKAVPGQISF